MAWPLIPFGFGVEGSGVVRVLGSGFGVWWVAVRVVGWSLVENCTVDASILFSVVKLSRADGGCLGTRSR
jgi:NADPH:quinone reductase-like Zn-dependent oxidoreductase